MKKFDKHAAELSFAAELARQDVTNNRKGIMPGSTASHCKDADYSVRDYLMAHGVGSIDDIRCRPGSKHDWELYVRKVHIVGETKVGAGALRYAKTEAELSFDLDDIYPGVDYIAYCADSKKLKAHPERKATLSERHHREPADPQADHRNVAARDQSLADLADRLPPGQVRSLGQGERHPDSGTVPEGAEGLSPSALWA